MVLTLVFLCEYNLDALKLQVAPIKFYFLSFIAILIISFGILSPSFNLAFEDEEWQGIVLPKTIYESYVTTKLTSYSSPMWFLTNLYTWLGPSFSSYFFLSFILRNLLAFSVLVFLYISTRNRLASFLGGVMVVVAFSGIQTTFEIINMISYISYIGWMIFLCAFYLNLDKLSTRYLIIMGTSLLMATFIAAFRIYPLYAWIFIVDSLRLFGRPSKDKIKGFLVRQSVVIAVFLFLYKIGIFSWYSRDASPGQGVSDASKFVSDSTSLFTNLNPNIASNYLKGLGNVIFPDILDKSGTISLFLGAFYLIILISLFVYAVKKRTRIIYLLFSFFMWPFLFYTNYYLVYINGVSKDTALLQSSMRYLFPPFIGLSIALAILLSVFLKKKNKLSQIVLFFVIIFILIHASTTYFYLNKLSKQRDGFYMVKIWQQIRQLVPESSLSSEKTNVFYFETDKSARAIYTVNDGFIGHVIALYKIDSKPIRFDSTEIGAFGKYIVPPLMSYEELVSYIKKNSADSLEGEIWNRIFALKVEGESVIDIKDEVRKRVEATLKE